MCVCVRLRIRGFICYYTYEFQREKEGNERGSAEEGERREVKNSRVDGPVFSMDGTRGESPAHA